MGSRRLTTRIPTGDPPVIPITTPSSERFLPSSTAIGVPDNHNAHRLSAQVGRVMQSVDRPQSFPFDREASELSLQIYVSDESSDDGYLRGLEGPSCSYQQHHYKHHDSRPPSRSAPPPSRSTSQELLFSPSAVMNGSTTPYYTHYEQPTPPSSSYHRQNYEHTSPSDNYVVPYRTTPEKQEPPANRRTYTTRLSYAEEKTPSVVTPPQPERSKRTNNAKRVEIAPNVWVRLRDARETWAAVERDFYFPIVCFGCSTELCCIQDADYCICPLCRVVSPMRDDSNVDVGKGGAGLGFTLDELLQWQSQILKARGPQQERYGIY